LAAPRERASPAPHGGIPEVPPRRDIGWPGMIVEVAGDDLPQPFPLLGDRRVPAPRPLAFDLLELRPPPVATGFPLEQEFAAPGLAADNGEAQKVARKLKVSGLPSRRRTRFCAAWRPNSTSRVFSR
jgi:hypothetical protein